MHAAARNYFWKGARNKGVRRKECTFKDRSSCESCKSCEFSLANVTELVEYHKWYAEDFMNETLRYVAMSQHLKIFILTFDLEF